jgi:hypothetical protein
MAQNKYRRTNFTEEVEVDGILEQDLADNNFDLFEIKREQTFFTLTRSYIQRPDLLSLKLYGKQNYWWIIAKANNIDDWWNDVSVGDIINVPNIRDIEDWYSKFRQRRKG